MSDVELWECDNCGERAINGNGPGWTSRGDERFHACGMSRGRVARQAAARVVITTTMTVPAASLVALLHGVNRWAADEDGVPAEMWDAYVAAHKALGLPERS